MNIKKYILTYSLISLISTQTVFAKNPKDNLIDFDFYVGKTSIYSEQTFNQKYNIDAAIPIPNVELKTKSDFAILNLDHKFGAKMLFNLNGGIQAGLEISAINPENYAKEGLISSSYLVKEAKLNDFVFKLDVNPHRYNTEYNAAIVMTMSIPRIYNLAAKKLTKGKFNNRELYDITLGRFSEYEYTLEADGTEEFTRYPHSTSAVTLSESDANDKIAMDLISEQINSYVEKNIEILYDVSKISALDTIIYNKLETHHNRGDLTFTDLKIRQAIKSVFLTPSLYYSYDLYDDFSVYAGLKAGYGHLSIMQEFCDLQIVTESGVHYKYKLRSNQEGYTWTGGLELGGKYVVSNLLQVGFGVHVNAYGNINKSQISPLDLIVYDETINKERLNLSTYTVKGYPKENKSIFGPIDVTTSFNITINL